MLVPVGPSVCRILCLAFEFSERLGLGGYVRPLWDPLKEILQPLWDPSKGILQPLRNA
jgi:hypothetical protein